jgi:formylglycine-generating enzyme required for sulfatase activity
MVCDSCNSTVSEDSIFCLTCGALQKTAHEEVIRGFAQELMDKGTTAYQQKRFEDAITQFTNVLDVLPEQQEAKRMLVVAEDEFKAISEALGKAKASLADRRYEEAQTQARNVLSLCPGQPEAAEILAEATRTITRFQENLVRGKECLESNRFEEAIENLRFAGEIDPSSSAVRNLLLSAQNQLATWTQEIDNIGKLRDAYSFDEAITAAEAMAERRPFDTKLQSLLTEIKTIKQTLIRSRAAGEEALSQGRWTDAVRAWGRVLSILPEDAQARENRDIAVAEAAKQRAARIRVAIKISVAAAIVLVVLILALTALSNRRHLAWGKEFLRSGEPEKALEEFGRTGTFFISTEELAQLKHDATYLLHLKRGDTAREKQDWTRADAEYREALRLAADQSEVNKRLELLTILESLQTSRALARDGDYDKATATAREASAKLTALGDFPDAALLRNQVTDTINSFLTLWVESVRKILVAQKYLDASVQLRQILSQFPGSAETRKLLGDCRSAWLKYAETMRKESKWEDAEKEYLKMDVPFPSDPEITRQIHITKAEHLLNEASTAMDRTSYKEALNAALKAQQEAQDIPNLKQEATDLSSRISAVIDNKYSLFLGQAQQFIKENNLESAKIAIQQAANLRETEETRALAIEIEDRMKTPEGMIYIPACPCTIGDSNQVLWKREGPAHKVDLPAYYIDAQPVTNAHYLKFVKATGHQMPPHWVKAGNKIPSGKENHPVTCVSLADAAAYAQWVKKRLPTEAEWEKAARGPEALTYPWGNTYEKGMANDERSGLRDTSPVGAFQKGKSPYGCLDMAGNVWQWTSSKISLYPGSDAQLLPEEEKLYVIKGGCFLDDELYLRSSFREVVDPDSAYALRPTLGFRCVADVRR